MPINIRWQSKVVGEPVEIAVPFLNACLKLTMVGEVITDACWCLEAKATPEDLPPFVYSVHRFLMDPLHAEIEVTLLRQGTDYSRKVWNALLTIPAGDVQTYSELAQILESGPRAVAGACRNNPYAGLIPCHRVVAKHGIGGFMGQIEGEFVELKNRLLEYERGFCGRGK